MAGAPFEPGGRVRYDRIWLGRCCFHAASTVPRAQLPVFLTPAV